MQMIFLFIFCAVVGLRAQDNNETESYEAFGFNDKQQVYLLKKKIAYNKEIYKNEIATYDKEIRALKTNLTAWAPMVNVYLRIMCGNRFRTTIEFIENNYVTKYMFISAFPSLREVMMKNIDGFNKLRLKNASQSGNISKTQLEENDPEITKTFFTRREKWFVLSEWFIQLKHDSTELANLEARDEMLSQFRIALLEKFQDGLNIADDKFPDEVSAAFQETWKMVTSKLVKKIDRVLTSEELEAVIGSLDTISKQNSACLAVIGQTKFIESVPKF